jgi:threonine dehydratase
MPWNAPRVKRAATEGYGATIVEYDPATEKREEIASKIRSESSPTLIPPFDHPDVVAGQGTAVLELLEETGRSTGCSFRAAAGGCSRDRRSRRGS